VSKTAGSETAPLSSEPTGSKDWVATPYRHWHRNTTSKTGTRCCINRSQLSYGLTGLALIRADGAQPSLHLDEYVFVPYIYGLVALLESTIKASSNQYFNTGIGRRSSIL